MVCKITKHVQSLQLFYLTYKWKRKSVVLYCVVLRFYCLFLKLRGERKHNIDGKRSEEKTKTNRKIYAFFSSWPRHACLYMHVYVRKDQWNSRSHAHSQISADFQHWFLSARGSQHTMALKTCLRNEMQLLGTDATLRSHRNYYKFGRNNSSRAFSTSSCCRLVSAAPSSQSAIWALACVTASRATTIDWCASRLNFVASVPAPPNLV